MKSLKVNDSQMLQSWEKIIKCHGDNKRVWNLLSLLPDFTYHKKI
jgi:hypothetical protein